MILSHRHRFIFLKTRKTAGTSIEIALSSLCGPDDIITPLGEGEELRTGNGPRNYDIPFSDRTLEGKVRSLFGVERKHDRAFHNHITAFKLRRIIDRKIWASYFKFTVERNPWDRLVSRYYWKYQSESERPEFRQFVLTEANSRKFHNFHVYSIGNRPVVDFIIRYEHLSEDFATVMTKLGIDHPPALERAKSGYREEKPWKDYYDNETREIVRKTFAREIKLMGYTF